jgi:alpha-beta hydrolase superfamily lysophospholipase
MITGLLQIVEQSIQHEQDLSPNRPIYLVGDSFGGCLALAVAARNPQTDLVLLLVNPGKRKPYSSEFNEEVLLS